MIGNVAELVLGCGGVIGRYIRLASDGSMEDLDGCERPATMGGAYYHAGLQAEFTFYGTVGFIPASPCSVTRLDHRKIIE